MLKSFISPVYDGQVIIRQDILNQIGIGSSGFLWGTVFKRENTLILSYIPPEYWNKAYKIIIHTHWSAGSVATAAAAIAALNLNTYSI